MCRFSVVACLAMVAAPAASAGLCETKDTFGECEKIVADKLNGESATDQKEAANELLAKTNTGADQALSATPTSVLSDFFPLLRMALGAPELDDSAGTAWVLAVNRCTPGSRQPHSVQCQWRANVGGATLYEPLRQALPATRAAELEQEIGSFEGSRFGFALNLESERYGRRLRFSEDASLYDALLDRARTAGADDLLRARARKDMVFSFAEKKIDDANAGVIAANSQRVARQVTSGTLRQARADDLSRASEKVGKIDADGDDGALAYNRVVAGINDTLRATGVTDLLASAHDAFDSMQPFDVLPGDAPDTVRAMWEESVRTDAGAGRSMLQELRRSGYFDLYRLANNQPQLNFGIDYRVGSDLVGPDEVRATLTWEFGYTNLNDLRRYASPSGQCSKRAASGDQDARAACLAEYLGREDVQADMDAGDRFALSVEFAHRARYALQSPGDSVALDLPSERSIIASLAWGRYLDLVASEDFGASRFDVVASYEDVGSDPSRRNRGSGSITFSQELTGGLVLSVAGLYESQPEFVGSTDDEWSSRISLNYKMGAPKVD